MTILTVVLGFLAKLFGLWVNKTPSIVTEAEGKGAAQEQAASQEKADATVVQAVDAAHRMGAVVASDGGLRNYEATDPNNRDNH